MLLVMRVTPFVMRLALLTRGTGIVAHRGIAMGPHGIPVRVHAILPGVLLVSSRIVVAADHHLRHRR
jgi:hypothetical protein